MRDIKTKPTMDKPKTRDKSASLPRDVSGQMKQQYQKQQERRRQEQEENASVYATDRLEDAAVGGVFASAAATKRAAQYARKKLTEQTRSQKNGDRPADTPIEYAPSDTAPTDRTSTGDMPRAESGTTAEHKIPTTSNPYHTQNNADTPSTPSYQERGRAAFRQKKAQEAAKGRADIVDFGAPPGESRAYNGGHGVSSYRSPVRQQQAAKQTVAEQKLKAAQNRQKAASRAQASAAKQRAVIKAKQAAKKLSPTQQAMKQAKQKAQREAQRQMARQAAHAAKVTAQATAKAVVALGKAIVAAVKALGAVIASGGWVAVLIIVIILFAVVAAVVASPFGIFFSGEDTAADTVPVSQVAAEQNAAFAAEIDAIVQSNEHHSMTLTGNMADWAEVLAVFAVKTAGSEDDTAMDVVTIDAARVGIIQTIFNEMNDLSYTVESIDHGDSDPDDEIDDSWTEKILHITITSKTADEMATVYGFTAKQLEMFTEMLEQRAMLNGLVGSLTVTAADAAEVLRNLPADLPEDRKAVIKTAMQLVGKVSYFWGGKSSAIGWDSRFGTPMEVWADGSDSTGTIRAYGLDCSGYVDWVFNNALGYVIGHGGGAASQHTYCEDISWDEAQIGDLAFYPDDEHIGIVAGWDEDGNVLIVHCASGYNNVVITGMEGFISVARPDIFTQEALDGAA